MATAYSDDLRRKLLQAHDEGEGTLQELADLFRVSYGWAVKISAARGKTGKMERQPGAKRGRVSKITPEIETYIKNAVAAKADGTIAELQLRLFEDKQLEVSIGRLWSALDKLNLRFKKNDSGVGTRSAAGSGRKNKVAVNGRRHRAEESDLCR